MNVLDEINSKLDNILTLLQVTQKPVNQRNKADIHTRKQKSAFEQVVIQVPVNKVNLVATTFLYDEDNYEKNKKLFINLLKTNELKIHNNFTYPLSMILECYSACIVGKPATWRIPNAKLLAILADFGLLAKINDPHVKEVYYQITKYLYSKMEDGQRNTMTVIELPFLTEFKYALRSGDDPAVFVEDYYYERFLEKFRNFFNSFTEVKEIIEVHPSLEKRLFPYD